MNAIVLGNGRSGKAAAALLRRDGYSVCVLDGNDAWPGGDWELCVTSPGIPLDHPWQIAARAAGVHVISELQLGACRFRAIGGRMLAVTGSKGKSSVVKLVAAALEGVPCGNYGLPLCEVALQGLASESPLPFAVVEVSSFQMETTELPAETFEAAAILNLQEDHLDRHGSVAAYHALKRKLLDFAKIKIVENIGTGPETKGTGPSFLGSDPKKSDKNNSDIDLFADSYFDNAVLRNNGLCAVSLMRAAGLDDDAIRDAFEHFEALPHRMQTVCVQDGITWIDDSKATSISALIAGVEMANSRFSRNSSDVFSSSKGSDPKKEGPVPTFIGSVPKVRLIAGGVPKGDDALLAQGCLAEGVVKVYLIGQCASAFAESWKDVVPCEICGTLEAAVAGVRRDASEGDCVLLSPGTASFDQFANYGERGDRFTALACQAKVSGRLSE
jgi:UDP-N-acetylmuramoylalanine--D-glutamate ligase